MLDISNYGCSFFNLIQSEVTMERENKKFAPLAPSGYSFFDKPHTKENTRK
jgi:hypothetical protein